MKFAQKYVFVRTPDQAELVISGLSPLSHKNLSDAATKEFPGAVPVSAGFFHFLPDGSLRTYGWSAGLNLNSRPTDAAFIAALASATETTNPPPAT